MVSSSGISFGGLASGIDTNSIIEQLLLVQRRPTLLYEQRRLAEEDRQAALARVGTSLSNLLTDIKALTTAGTFSGRTAAVAGSDEDAAKVAVSASTSAAAGSFTLDIVSLATATSVRSTGAVGEGIDAAGSLDEAGFRTAPAAGTFTINGTQFTIDPSTATTLESAASVGAAVDPSVPLDSAGLDIAPASGTFEINGVAIAFDASTDSLTAVINRINGSAAGVTASFEQDTGVFTLTRDEHGPDAITVADTSGNFLEAMRLVDGVGATIGTETLGSDLPSLNDLVTTINSAGIGVTASIVNDAYGRANLLQLDGGGSNVSLGAGSDTSNFLSITHLLASPAGTTRTSTQGLGGADPGADLSAARLATALSQPSGTFEVNGVEFSYDETTDSLSNVITRINQSNAGVTATYDTFADQLVITAKGTGSTSITLEDTAGNFLAAMGVAGATQTIGENASYRIDGGALRYSSSNTVSDAVPGVTMTFKETTDSAIAIEVSQDNSSASGAVKEFVEQYNSTRSLIADLTKYVEDGQSGVLLGDGTMRMVDRRLRSLVTGPAFGISDESYDTLADIGLSFGAFGSAVGTTDTLLFDAGKFESAMQDDPDAVHRLLAGFEASATLEPGGSGSIASISGTPTAADEAGTYEITSTSLGDLTVVFRPADGSTSIVSTGTIGAGGTNTTLIPGVTITAKATLVDGVDTITLTATEQGVATSLQSYVDSLTRTGGILEGRDEQIQSRIDSINEQVEKLEARLVQREQQLVRQFAAMEQTIARLQGQQQALAGMVAQLQNIRPPSPSR